MKESNRREGLAPATHVEKKNLKERIEHSEKRVREFLEERDADKDSNSAPTQSGSR